MIKNTLCNMINLLCAVIMILSLEHNSAVSRA